MIVLSALELVIPTLIHLVNFVTIILNIYSFDPFNLVCGPTLCQSCDVICCKEPLCGYGQSILQQTPCCQSNITLNLRNPHF
jgi:hypothetical protein